MRQCYRGVFDVPAWSSLAPWTVPGNLSRLLALPENKVTRVLFFWTWLHLLDFFFFFQAEDGIRDLIVTGVQTCALPISSRSAWRSSAPARAHREEGVQAGRARRARAGADDRHALREDGLEGSGGLLGQDRKSVV